MGKFCSKYIIEKSERNNTRECKNDLQRMREIGCLTDMNKTNERGN